MNMDTSFPVQPWSLPEVRTDRLPLIEAASLTEKRRR